MKCPHCLQAFFEDWSIQTLSRDIENAVFYWGVRFCTCPACKKLIVEFGSINASGGNWYHTSYIRPRTSARASLGDVVPDKYKVDYEEACTVLSDSPKASAALSRRCLQYLLRNEGNAVQKDLVDQINFVLESKQLPSYLADNLDAIRNIGNFAAHPAKSKSSGEVLDVEEGEAEWNLDVLEGLFEFYFVEKQKNEKRRDDLNKKLAEIGKPPMKVPKA